MELDALCDSTGKNYIHLRRELKIKPWAICSNILTSWFMIFGQSLIFLMLAKAKPGLAVMFPVVLIGSLWFGFWIVAYAAHFHEAAHYNLTENRHINDLLAMVLFTPILGLRIQNYRASHWDHHKYLGTPRDTEITYISALSTRKIFLWLTGIYTLQSIWRYSLNFLSADRRTAETKGIFDILIGTIYFGTVQAIILFSLVHFISFACAVSWIIGLFVYAPFFSGLRQTLEHRSLKADAASDYRKTPHGEVNRMFGNDFFSRNFGSAGFNRHLLHHLDPSVSYTCFDEMEYFLMDTSLRSYLEENRTTYYSTLKEMV